VRIARSAAYLELCLSLLQLLVQEVKESGEAKVLPPLAGKEEKMNSCCHSTEKSIAY